jgi:uncharacterized protein involved in response to NO
MTHSAEAHPSLAAAGPASRAAGLPILAYGFRPFFLLAGLQAALAIPVWMLVYRGSLALPEAFPPSLWHSHEMVYGFAAATLAGFFLTAVPNWTGAAPVRGGRLGALALLWLAGRVLFWTSGALPAWLPMAVDLAFLPALALAIAPALLAPSAQRNRPFLAVLAVLFAANLLIHLSRFDIPWADPHRAIVLAIDVFVLLITVIGGRIIPSFTAPILALQGGPAPRAHPLLERLAPGLTALLLPVDLFLGDSVALGLVAIAAAAAHLLRLRLWHPLRTRGKPILWVLHLGYAWLPVGLALRGMAALDDLVPASAGLHALTIGAVGTMTLAVMSRAALGHTGRPLKAARITVAAYGLVTLAAIIRVAGAILCTQSYALSVELSGALWIAAFALFALVYAPILLRPRADGRPG